ncbi:tyrosine-protein kinase receptor Tie-1-like [Diadema setosum]|uniref:tyrosine-protein kinase receptor Tie-1-like n=1 Tax=Diadema setosum TaxID=31175 RepID=UPI003B3AD826
MLNGQPSLEGDVWSYGVLLWEIVTLGGKPYPTMTMEEVKKQVTNGYTMPCPKHCGQELFAVMTMCWVMELKKRCDFHQIMRKIELVMEKDHEYLSLQDLEEGLYEYPDNVV